MGFYIMADGFEKKNAEVYYSIQTDEIVNADDKSRKFLSFMFTVLLWLKVL